MTLFKAVCAGLLATAAGLAFLGQAQAQDAQVWSYWGTGAEANALKALIETAEKKYPVLKLGTRVISGNDAEMRRAMQIAFLGGNPPAVFQSGMAQGLKAFKDANRLAPVGAVLKDVKGFSDLPEGVKRIVTFGGKVYGVPLDMHIISNVFYNKEIFSKLGLTPPKTAEEFQAVAAKLKKAGYQALGDASGPSWTLYTTYPFFLKALGTKGFFELGSGAIPFTDTRVKSALESWTKTYVDNYMKDWSSYSWSDTAGQFAKGKVAMYEMGDWLTAYLADAGWTYGKEYSSFPAPGAGKAVVYQMDILAKPEGIGKEAAKASDDFLKVAMSPEGQLAFNIKKGSVAPNPAAGDVGYPPYGKMAYAEIQDAAKDNAVMPNLKFLFPVQLGDEFGNRIVAYAQNPSDNTLDDMLNALEGMRKKLQSEGKFVKW